MLNMVSFSLKQSIQQSLESNDIDTIVALAKKNRRVLALLVRSAYEKETLVAWRAIKAAGLVARALVKTDHEFLRETIRKLLWSLSDESGGIGWSAPEIIGEIVSADPQRFSDVIPLIAEVYGIEEDVFRPGVVYALGRIAEVSPELVLPYREILIKALSDSNPLTKVYALEVVERLWRHESKEGREALTDLIKGLQSNANEVWIYRYGGFFGVEVGIIAKNLLNKYTEVV